MTKPKGYKVFRLAASLVLGGCGYALFLTSDLNTATAILSAAVAEILRGPGTYLLGPLFSVGMALGDVGVLWLADCDQVAPMERLVTILPHLALGWLWCQHGWKGGTIAFLLSWTWYWGMSNPQFWFIPMVGFIGVYIGLLRATLTQPQKPSEVSHAV
jgi:hypothetical protein